MVSVFRGGKWITVPGHDLKVGEVFQNGPHFNIVTKRNDDGTFSVEPYEVIPKPRFRNPQTTVDGIVTRMGPDGTEVLLIERKNAPLGWAFPGGFVNEGESCETACKRECEEETGLRVRLSRQFHTYSDPKRDPRRHIMTTVFVAKVVGGELKAADDAKNAKFYPVSEIPWGELVFDHAQILRDFLAYERDGIFPSVEGR